MFRNARRLAPLLRSLLLGAMAAGAVTASSGILVGCSDENDPKTHIGYLDDAAKRPAAIKRLIQFFEDAMTKDKGERSGPSVKPLLDTIIEPMTQQCVSGDLDDRTRANLIKFLSDARDARAEACFTKVFKDYKVDGTEEDVRWASRAVGALKLKGSGAALMEVFVKLKTSKPKADAIYRDVHDALIEVADPAWESQLIGLVNRPINDRKDGAMLKDEMFWQITAAELLGVLKSNAAVKPLIKAILSPNKAEIGNTALNALIKIGKPSIAPALALLKGEDKDLVDYAKTETVKATPPGSDGKVPASAIKAAETAHIGTAASILAAIGRDEASAPLIEALEKSDEVSRVVIARELVNLPTSPAVITAFQSAYDKTTLSLTVPVIGGGREALLDRAGWFFDASFVPWLLKGAREAKGEASDVDPVRTSTLLTVAKLMKPDQVAEADELFRMGATGGDGKPSTVGKAIEKEYKIAKELLTACGDKVECYLAKLAEPASHGKETVFQGIKSIYMVGVLGGPDVRPKLIALMPKLESAEVRGLAGVVIDHFSPKGDKAIAESLQKIIDEGEASKDGNKKAGNASFKQVVYRLHARAQ
jgi:hypothetical protein